MLINTKVQWVLSRTQSAEPVTAGPEASGQGPNGQESHDVLSKDGQRDAEMA